MQYNKLLPLCLTAAIILSSCASLSPKEALDKYNYEQSVRKVAGESTEIVLAEKQGEFSVIWQQEVGNMPAFASLGRYDDAGKSVWCVVSKNGKTHFIDDNGNTIGTPFSLSLGGESLSAVAACNGKIIAVTDELGILSVHDMAGMPLWQQPLHTKVYSAPQINAGRLFVLGVDGSLSAYSAIQGTPLWQHQTKPAAGSLITPIDTSPVIYDNIVYAGLSNGILLAFDATDGRQLWDSKIFLQQQSNPVSNISNLTTPVVSDGILCAAGYQSTIACLSPSDGLLQWSRPLSALYRPALSANGNAVYAADVRGFLHGFNAKNGEPLWARNLGVKLNTPIVTAKAVIVGGDDGVLRAFSSDKGELLAETSLGTDSIIYLHATPKHLAEPTQNGTLVTALTRNGSLIRLQFNF